MKCWPVLFYVVALLSFPSLPASAQKNTRGIVVDSMSLKALPGVHVRIKSTNRVAVTNGSGTFQLTTNVGGYTHTDHGRV